MSDDILKGGSAFIAAYSSSEYARRMLFDEIPVDFCHAIIEAARQFYAEPVSSLKYKKPLLEMHRESGSDETYGNWVSSVPKPGDVAACANYRPKKQNLLAKF